MFFVMASIFFACAIILGFFGYRVIRAAMALGGFVAGALIGSALFSFVGPLSESLAVEYEHIIWMAIPGIALAALSYKIYKIALFYVTMILVAAVAYGAVVPYLTESWHFLFRGAIALVIGAVVGAVVCAVQKPAIMVVTGICGGFLFSYSLAALIGHYGQPMDEWMLDGPTLFFDLPSQPGVFLAVGVVMAALGIVFQFRYKKRRRRKKAD